MQVISKRQQTLLWQFWHRLRWWIKEKMIFIITTILLLMLMIVYFWHRIVITVKSGEAGILYQWMEKGTVTDYIFPEGVHLIFPWDTMYIYDVRVQTVRHEFSALTAKGLPIQLDLAIRFYPEYEMVGVLHKTVGPNYIEKIVVPQIESVLRREIGQYEPSDIYTTKKGILQKIILEAIEETSKKFVQIDDVIIRKISLPEAIQVAIEDKLTHEQKFYAYEYRLKEASKEAERKRIEATGIRDYQETVSQTLSEDLLRWQGIKATKELADSDNAKVVVIGAGDDGLPIILGR